MLFFYVIWLLVLVLFGAVAWLNMSWMLYAWRSKETKESTSFADTNAEAAHSFSLLVPARHERAVLEQTLNRLMWLDHPDYEVICIVGHDDPETRAIADKMAERHPEMVRVVVDRSVPKNKPRALNAALPHVTKEVVGVFDAEDVVHPDLLQRSDQSIQLEGADVVQSGVQLMNFQSSWFSVRNVLEYYFWFRSRLHLQARLGFIPLGGNTVFVKTQLLREVGGWDADCLAEDCDLGARLSVRDAKIVVAYEPDLVTREETPDSLTSLMKQRTRWNQGFLQVLRKPEWRQLPLRRRAVAALTLGMPVFQGISALVFPLAILTMLLLKLPVGIALLTFLPVIPMLAMLSAELVGLREFGRDYDVSPRFRDYARLVAGAIPYQLILSYSAARALWREVGGRRNWEKTKHVGAHLGAPELAPELGPSILANESEGAHAVLSLKESR